MGAKAVLMKGGHVAGDRVVDVLMTPDGETAFEGERIDSRHTHGTGCTLASACAAGIGPGPAADRGGGAGLGLCARGHAARAGLRRRARPAGPRLAAAGASVSLEDRLVAIVRRSEPLMQVLTTVRALDLPDWLIFSGAIYQRVLNDLTGRPPDYGIKDYDVGYFDARTPS